MVVRVVLGTPSSRVLGLIPHVRTLMFLEQDALTPLPCMLLNDLEDALEKKCLLNDCVVSCSICVIFHKQ